MSYFHWEFSFLDELGKLQSPFLDALMVFFSTLGNAGILWIAVGLLMLCKKKYRKCGCAVLLVLLLSVLTANVALKNLVERPRPCWIRPKGPLLIKMPLDFSFPSGHTQSSFAAAMVIFLHHRKEGIAAFLVAAGIAFSRLYLYVHFPTDILAGIIIGCGLAALTTRLIASLWNTKPE